MPSALDEDREGCGEQDHPQELWAQPEGNHPDSKAGEGKPGGHPRLRTGRSAGAENQPGDQLRIQPGRLCEQPPAVGSEQGC